MGTFYSSIKASALKKTLEKDIEADICQWLNRQKIFVFKVPKAGYAETKTNKRGEKSTFFRKQTSPYALNGVPDLIVIMDGRFIGLEVKSLKGIQSDAQVSFQEQVEKAGGDYFLVRSLEDVILLLS